VTALLGAGNDELNQAIESTFSEAKQILLNESVRNFAPIPFLATLGKISARTGETDRSKAIHDLIQSVAKTSGIGLWESYLNILEGEILLAEGDGSEAMRRFHRAITPQAPFQAHDSLAHALEVQGHFKEAIQENLWMEGRRGRAFAECCFLCCVRSQNILDWNLALLRLGRLYEASGDVEQAKAYYRRFYERWSGGDDVPPLKEAGERLRALEHGT
jgi:tetratricopeptide (TPR) repeat protein